MIGWGGEEQPWGRRRLGVAVARLTLRFERQALAFVGVQRNAYLCYPASRMGTAYQRGGVGSGEVWGIDSN